MAIPLIGWISLVFGISGYFTSARNYGWLLTETILFGAVANVAFAWEWRREKRRAGATIGLTLATLVILGSMSRLFFSCRLFGDCF